MNKQKNSQKPTSSKLSNQLTFITQRATLNSEQYLQKLKLQYSEKGKISPSLERHRKTPKMLAGENRYTEVDIDRRKENVSEGKKAVKLPQIKSKRTNFHKSSEFSDETFKKQGLSPNFFDEIQNYLASSISTKKRIQSSKSKNRFSLNKELHEVHRSKAGTNGRNIKINQDIEIIDQKLPFGVKLFCVCDGHGVNGHHVSGFIKKKLLGNEEYLRKSLKKLDTVENLQTEIYLCLQRTNDDLLNSEINTELSGSTVVAIFLHENVLYSYNIGDSRAILLNYEYDVWKPQQLTNDHKPSRYDEAKRIKAVGGRIECQMTEKGDCIGPLRVWMKNIKSPGLAMTRSFGDKAGIKAGTTSEPETSRYRLQQKNKYLLIASDGIWQYLQNDDISKFFAKAIKQNKLEQVADNLMEATVKVWNEKCLSRDDITFILVRLPEWKE